MLKIRACYLHCYLKYANNDRMSNESLRDRFRLPVSKSQTISQIIAATIEANKIKLEDPEASSKRYAKYVPHYA